MAEHYNDEQKAFIECDDRRVLLVATAGSGKTRCCIAYCERKLGKGVKPSEVLAVTFTRKASAEFAERLGQATGLPRENFSCGTYHSIANSLIREEPAEFGLRRGFTVLEESDSRRIIKRVGADCGLPPKIGDKRLGELLSLARNELFLPEVVSSDDETCDKFKRFVVGYRDALTERNCVDFDGLLELWKWRLQCEPDYAEALRKRWTHVVVDEMQDNNLLNFSIIKLLAPKTLVCVGDPNQSIYEWRGANSSLIDRFVAEEKATILTMRTNYRSGQTVLDAANMTMQGTASELAMTSGTGADSSVYTFTHDDDIAEAERATDWIQKAIAANWKPKDIAVLSRTSRALRRVEVALRNRGIDYRSYHGRSVAESPHLLDACYLARLALNPKDGPAAERIAAYFTESKSVMARLGERPDMVKALLPDMDELITEIRTTPHERQLQALPEIFNPYLVRRYKADHEKRAVDLKATCDQLRGSTLETLLDTFALDAPVTTAHPDTCVTLSTVHSSKGLEWPLVWVIDASTASFGIPPNTRERKVPTEERRLFYVALTRAKTQLVLSCPKFGGGQKKTPVLYLPDKSWPIDYHQESRARILEARAGARISSPVYRPMATRRLADD